MQNLINEIKKSISFSSEAEGFIYSLAKEKKVSKGEVLIRQGQTVTKTFFVVQGSLRSFCTDKGGKQHTLQFAIKDWWISDFTAIFNKEPALLSVVGITDAVVIEFDFQQLDKVYLQYPEFDLFIRKNLDRHIICLQKRILNQIKITALERYKLFLNKYPHIEQNVSNYHIASYLGITKQSLSRLRSEIAKN